MRRLFIAGALLGLAACKAEPETNARAAQSFVDDMVFFQHPSGVCFAVVYPNTLSQMMAEVDCKKVDAYLTVPFPTPPRTR